MSNDWRAEAERPRAAVAAERARAWLHGSPPPGPPGPIASMRDAITRIEGLLIGPPGMMPRTLSRPWAIFLLGLRHWSGMAMGGSLIVLGGLLPMAVMGGDHPAFHMPIPPSFVSTSDVLAVSTVVFALVWATLATPARHLAHGLDDRHLSRAVTILEEGANVVPPVLRDEFLRDMRSRVERRLRWWVWAAAALWAPMVLAMRGASERPDDANSISAAALFGITLLVWAVALAHRTGALRILRLVDLASAALAGGEASADGRGRA